MSTTNEQLLRHYAASVNQQDLAACMACFAEGASVLVKDQVHQGLPAIEAWHKERFDANFQVEDPGNYASSGDEDSLEFQFKSDRLAGRRMDKLPASFVAKIEGGQFTKLQVKLRLGAGIMKFLGVNP